MSNYDLLNKHPDVQNVHPKFIAVVAGVMQEVGRDVDGVVYLTDAGKKLLGVDEVEVAEPAKPARAKKAEKVVQSAEPANDEAGEFDVQV